ncbi:MAG: hypothetical protein JWN36_315 [Microbacteriaceae bacterium]|nr:hypothetical protein [Microbacteriaceae bacterium]
MTDARRTIVRRGFDRIKNLSDGIVAIAVTLLILPLVDVATGIGKTDVGVLLRENSGTFIAFALSFIVIARLWVQHHGLFRELEGYTRSLVWANMLWLAAIIFLPFPTELVSLGPSGDPRVAGLYVGTIAVASIANLVMHWQITRSPGMLFADARGRIGIIRALVDAIATVVATLLSLFVPHASLWPLLLLIPAGYVGSWLSARRENLTSTRRSR